MKTLLGPTLSSLPESLRGTPCPANDRLGGLRQRHDGHQPFGDRMRRDSEQALGQGQPGDAIGPETQALEAMREGQQQGGQSDKGGQQNQNK